MAQQKGFIRLKTGSMGDTTFVKTKDGYRAQEKMVVNSAKFKTDPAFARVRENASNFSRAAKNGQVIRASANALLQTAKDPKVVSRLVHTILQIIKKDPVSPRGQGNIIDGPTLELVGFDFNADAKLTVVVPAVMKPVVNRVTGQITLNMPSFIPTAGVVPPAGTTHFEILSAGAEIDFALGTFVAEQKQTAILPWDSNPTAAISLVHQVTANSTLPLFLVAGIKFYQQHNTFMYPLNKQDINALRIIDVNKV